MSRSVIDPTLVRNAPRSTDDLLRLLFEGLDWPQPATLEIEEIPLLDWSSADLHLDPDAIARLTSIQQLPRLTADQPFGVFILGFEGGRLPIGAVRRVVDKLVRKQRARKAQAATLWDLENLIFFCQAGEDVDLLHVVSFRHADQRPVMKVISWSTDATDNRIDLVAASNLPAMAWPAEVTHAEEWRERWTSAFTATYRQGIRSAATLASRMADVARDVRDEVLSLYQVETETGPLRQLFVELKQSLRADLTPETFADMYAQTMVYGLLTARISNPEDFSADALDLALTFENPLLDALYASFRDKGDDTIDVDEFGLRDLAEMLGAVDVDQLLADFGQENRKDDPVVFFYEEFLEKYDPKQRQELGTYYTPVPVVRAMVRLVDEILKEDLGLSRGVADSTTWGEHSRRQSIDVPDAVKPGEPVVRAIDPATGTGTYLLEWLRQGVRSLEDASGGTVDPEEEVELLERIDAFEISLSSYAVAHLKTSLQLPRELRAKHHMNILLTDTLGGRQKSQLNMLDDDPIAEEGQRAERVKFEDRHNIVIGNPPYDRVAQEGSGGWITNPDDGSRAPFADILDPAREHTIFSHHASLYNLYVYFWRWAIWKVFEQTAEGPAVVSFITASSWLTGPGFLGLRKLARELVDDIYVVDLGGDNLGTRKEENVFPIQNAVAIVVLVRAHDSDRNTPARAQYARIEGTRAEKLSALEDVSRGGTDWQPAPTGWFDRLIPPTGAAGWSEFPLLTDLFPWQQPGAMLSRTWPISPDRGTLRRRWRRLMSTDDPGDRAACYVTPRSGRNIYTSVAGLPRLADEPIGAEHRPIVRFGYRSFDRQWTFDDPRLAKTESPSLWAALSSKQVFLTTLTTTRLGAGPAATAVASVPDKHHFRGSYGGKDVLPLYRDADGTPNVDPAVTATIREILEASSVSADDLFAYVYGILAGSDYTTRFLEELETPGPRIPLTATSELFEQMAELGRNLLWLHTYAERFNGPDRPDTLPLPEGIDWTSPVETMPETPRDCRYDRTTEILHVGDGMLSGVREDVWTFEVSGMQVVKKWLGYRTRKGAGRASSGDKPLDRIRPEEWHPDWNRELRELVYVLTATLDYLPAGTELLERICDGPLIPASDLPPVPEHLRKVPKVKRGEDGQLDLGD